MIRRSSWIRSLASSIPISKAELGTFTSTLLLFFFISVVYNLLRPLKITLVIGSPGSGAEVIPYLKVWAVLPGAFFFSYLFSVLNRYLDRERVFYAITGLFTIFYAIFAVILYPNSEWFELQRLAGTLDGLLPRGFSGLISMIRYWHLTLFYVFAELWGSVVLSMLFWGFVNESTSFGHAKRVYALFALGANIASIAAGQIGYSLTKSPLSFMPGQSDWERSVYSILSLTVAACFVLVALFRYLSLKQDQLAEASPGTAQKSHQKVSFTFLQCVKEMAANPYLRYLALIVLCYNWVFNLTDVIWTDRLHEHYADSLQDLNAYMSTVSMAKGFLAAAVAVVLAVMQGTKWKRLALVTPLVLLGSSMLFFPLAAIEGSAFGDLLVAFIGCPIIQLTVLVGAIQNSLTRACKYTVFDASKEMAYIPLSVLDKRKGKAVIDGIGSRMGKSIGSVTYQVMLPFSSSIAATIPYVGILVVLISGVWITSVVKLSRLIGKTNSQRPLD